MCIQCLIQKRANYFTQQFSKNIHKLIKNRRVSYPVRSKIKTKLMYSYLTTNFSSSMLCRSIYLALNMIQFNLIWECLFFVDCRSLWLSVSELHKIYQPNFYVIWWKGVTRAKDEPIIFWSGSDSQGGSTNSVSPWLTLRHTIWPWWKATLSKYPFSS